jgi:hypothetical protein
MEGALSPLAAWDNFYVIIGSSAAALTGLQFVVIALGAESRSVSTSSDTIDAFGTPNVMHFSAVLLISAILSAPWTSLVGVAAALGACGVAGVIYVVIVFRRAMRQKDYDPVMEDWIWHVVLPFIAYGLLVAGATSIPSRPTAALFAVGGATLLLMFIGIHNAWDTVTYLALKSGEEKPRKSDASRHER